MEDGSWDRWQRRRGWSRVARSRRSGTSLTTLEAAGEGVGVGHGADVAVVRGARGGVVLCKQGELGLFVDAIDVGAVAEVCFGCWAVYFEEMRGSEVVEH